MGSAAITQNDNASGFGPVFSAQTVIPINTSTSGIVNLGAAHFMALYLPAMTGTAFTILAAVGVGVGDTEVDIDAATFQQVYDETGAALSITFAQGTVVGVGSNVMARLGGVQYIKLVSNGTEAAARTIGLGMKV
jgi:hypothetical protein